MQFSERRNLTRWFIIVASFFIVILILWNTYNFFQIFKNEERAKMEFWASALTTIANANENTDIELPLQIITKNTTIPIFITDSKENIIDFNNIDEIPFAETREYGKKVLANYYIYNNYLNSENRINLSTIFQNLIEPY